MATTTKTLDELLADSDDGAHARFAAGVSIPRLVAALRALLARHDLTESEHAELVRILSGE